MRFCQMSNWGRFFLFKKVQLGTDLHGLIWLAHPGTSSFDTSIKDDKNQNYVRAKKLLTTEAKARSLAR